MYVLEFKRIFGMTFEVKVFNVFMRFFLVYT